MIRLNSEEFNIWFITTVYKRSFYCNTKSQLSDFKINTKNPKYLFRVLIAGSDKNWWLKCKYRSYTPIRDYKFWNLLEVSWIFLEFNYPIRDYKFWNLLEVSWIFWNSTTKSNFVEFSWIVFRIFLTLFEIDGIWSNKKTIYQTKVRITNHRHGKLISRHSNTPSSHYYPDDY